VPHDPPPVDASLFASLDPPRLAGARCANCGTVTFPAAGSCPKCMAAHMEPYALPDRGTVWTWTVQGFAPKPPYVPPPHGFRPFPVGYVDLGDVKVESRLTASTAKELRTGMEMELVVVPFRTDDDGNEVVTFAFRPVGG